ncbi:hypothetical protein A9Q99_04990 [Gammaproteobacteria bacterium 45_16_T64]|nr:hypothetical protein A9Q99_04990 [Gammaproteobacteria bacterium 45_16_T64]
MMVFLRVVDCGSISGAAEQLAISKSVVSQQLSALEKALGVSLLNRTTRTQILTPAGRDFYQQCQKIEKISQQAWNDAQEAQHLPVGPVTITAPHALIESVVAPAIVELLVNHPGIRPTILANDQRINLIDEGVDLAIRVGDMPNSNFKQRLLGRFSEVLCADSRYVKQMNISEAALIDDKELRHQCDYIANAWQGGAIQHRFIHSETGTVGDLSFNATRFADSLPVVIAYLKGASGLAFIPDFLMSTISEEKPLVNLLPNHHSDPVSVYGVHGFGKHLPHVVELCLNAIKKKMDGMFV